MWTRRNRWIALTVFAAVLAAPWVGWRWHARAAEEQKADAERVAAIRHIMQGIHQPHCSAIGKLLEGDGPQGDAAFADLALHVALLNESGHLLMENNRCPDAVWAEATAALRRETARLFAAAAEKDVPASREAFKGVTGACGQCHARHKPSAPAKIEERPSAIADIMSGINQPQCSALGQALKDPGPDGDEAWQAVARHAALLNEAGHSLMQNNRCPDAAWKDASTALREGASRVVHAARERKLPDARAAFKEVTNACGACHKVHRKPPA